MPSLSLFPSSPLTIRPCLAARESIWILDWWLSPELYLRRPPSKNEQYRLDNLLKAAAERGVKVRIIVYKEVAKALTCKVPMLMEMTHPLDRADPSV
jgi:phospholipase D1/2